MSVELKDLEAHVVFKNPRPGERKKMVKASFETKFRTVSECRADVLTWARGQYESAADLHVDVFKPDARHKHWRADLLRGTEVLARISLTPRRAPEAPSAAAMF